MTRLLLLTQFLATFAVSGEWNFFCQVDPTEESSALIAGLHTKEYTCDRIPCQWRIQVKRIGGPLLGGELGLILLGDLEERHGLPSRARATPQPEN